MPEKLQSNLSKEVSITIDWISATSHAYDRHKTYSSHPSIRDWENWRACDGRLGYDIGAKHTTGVTALSNSKRRDMGIHTIYTGKSIKRIERMYDTSGFDILKYHVESGHSIARVDIAVDFINCGLSVEEFANQWRLGNCVTRLRNCNEVRSLDNEGHTLYIGSQKKRKKLIRIYNKAVEQNVDINWVRVELQLMGRPATQLGKLWIDSGNDNEFLLRGIKSVVNFPTVKAWSDVFEGITQVKIGSQSSEKGDTRDWLFNQVIPALAREIVLDSEFWIQFSYMKDNEVERLRREKK